MTQAPTPDYAAANTGPPANNGLGIAALICGIIAVLIAWIPCVNFVALILALVALALGVAGWISASGKPNQKAMTAIVGIILSIVAVVLFFISWAATGFVAERFGGQGVEYLLRTGYGLQAEALAVEARTAGVDEATITEARAELDAVLQNLSVNFSDQTSPDRAEQEAEAALQAYRDKLEAAAGQPLSDPDVDMDADNANE